MTVPFKSECVEVRVVDCTAAYSNWSTISIEASVKSYFHVTGLPCSAAMFLSAASNKFCLNK